MTRTTFKLNSQNPINSCDLSTTAHVQNLIPATEYFDSLHLQSSPQMAHDEWLKSGAVDQGLQVRWLRLKGLTLGWWNKLSLRSKATILALTIGVFPVATVGGIAHSLANSSMKRQIITEQENRTLDIKQGISAATRQLVDDAEIVTSSPLLANPKLSATATLAQKVALLNSFVDACDGRYESVVVFDLKGNLLFQSKSTLPYSPNKNYSDREDFQRAIATRVPAVHDPELFQSSNKVGLEVAAPIKDVETGQLLGVVQMRMPLVHLIDAFKHIHAQGWEYQLIGSNGRIFAADEADVVGRASGADFQDLPRLRTQVLKLLATNQTEKEDVVTTQRMWDKNDQSNALVSFSPMTGLDGVQKPGWGLAVSRPEDTSFAPLRELRLTLLLGTGVAALLVAVTAIALAKRATRPILLAAKAVTKIGWGELDTRVEVRGKDEVAALGSSINSMAEQLEELVQQKAAEAKRSQLLKDVTLKIASSLDPAAIFSIAVEEGRKALQSERVIVCYKSDRTAEGTIIAESVADGWFSTLGMNVASFFADEDISQQKQRLVQATADIYQANFTDKRIEQLEAIALKAYVVAPIIVDEELVGFLMAHQCSVARNWKTVEIDFFAQLATQVGLALLRANLLEQQKNAKEKLQRRAIELLMEVEPISQGDLTIRAKVTEDEVGTIADSYNSTVENLQQLVIQVQTASNQVEATASDHEKFVQTLSQGAWQQSEEIVQALKRIQAMAGSAHAVAMNAEKAASAVQQAAETVEVGDEAMNLAVDGIQAIRETVAETAKKVKCLGESSQKIYKVVNLISHFADKTNLLAMNASIEAARAGEEGRGFAKVADEVRLLAQQSAKATAEIEKLVSSIQRETNEVGVAMEAGTQQVVIGTKLVEDTRQQLKQITNVSTQINQLVKAIAIAAVEQSQDSETVTQTIAGVAAIAEETSLSATEVSASFKELMVLAQCLADNVRQFKVE